MKVRSLVVRYDEKLVLDHFSADFSDGITCIVGPSGYGKTTLLNVIAGLIVPESGTIEEYQKISGLIKKLEEGDLI